MTNDVGPRHAKSSALSNDTYDLLKNIVLVWLPGFGALYFGLSELWNLPYALQVVGTTTLLSTFLGLGLKKSSNTYNHSDAKFDGDLVVDTSDDAREIYRFESNIPIEDMQKKEELIFKVRKPV